MKGETKYDLKRVTAQKGYDDALAAANVVWTAKYVEIQVAIYLDQPIPHVPSRERKRGSGLIAKWTLSMKVLFCIIEDVAVFVGN